MRFQGCPDLRHVLSDAGLEALKIISIIRIFDKSFVKRVSQAMPCLFGIDFRDSFVVTCPR